MPTTNGSNPTGRKQSLPPESLCEQTRRYSTLQSDLLRIAGAMGMPRSLLQRRDNWDNASRDPINMPYRPYDRVQTMIRDVVRTVAKRGTSEQRLAVAKAVTQFYEVAMRDALEPLGVESDECVIALTLECNREVSEAECALTKALTSQSPETFEVAARETTEALTVMERLRDGLHAAARAAFYTPRTNRLFAAR